MEMSSTMTSGFSLGAASSSARPSDTAPTTSQAGDSSCWNAASSMRVIIGQQDARHKEKAKS